MERGFFKSGGWGPQGIIFIYLYIYFYIQLNLHKWNRNPLFSDFIYL